MKFLKIESYKKGIIFSTLFNVIAKGLLFLVSLLIAFYFGSESRTDIYFYAYNVVVLIAGFFTMLNSAVLIPEAMRIRAEEGAPRSADFLNFFIGLYVAFALVLCVIFLLDPVGSFALISNFEGGTLVENKDLLVLSLPLIWLMTITGLLTDILVSFKFFTITMIVNIINSTVSLAFLVVFHEELSIASILVGLLTGFTINVALLLYLMKRYLNWKFSVRFSRVRKGLWKNVGFAQAGNITTVLNSYVPIYLFSGFNPGVITALTLAQQLSILPNSLVVNHFTSVASIKFNELYSHKQYPALSDTFVSTANFLVFILMPVSGFMFLFSHEIITLVFEHGRFSETGVAYSSLFLKYLGLQLPLIAVNNLFSRLLMAGHKVGQSFIYQIIFNSVLVVILYFIIQEFGIIGYPISLCAIYLLNVFVCYYLEKLFFDIIDYAQILKMFLLLMLFNAAIVISIFGLFKYLSLDNYVIKLVAGGLMYCILLLALNQLFLLNDTVATFVKNVFSKKYRL